MKCWHNTGYLKDPNTYQLIYWKLDAQLEQKNRQDRKNAKAAKKASKANKDYFMNIKALLWHLGILLLTINCSPFRPISEGGQRAMYKSKNGEALIFDKNQFYLVNLRSRNNDTLALGNWRREGNRLLVLNSPDWLNNYFIEIEVSEKVKANSDSVYFIVNSPLQSKFRRANPTGGHLVYGLQIDAFEKGFDYFGKTMDLENNVVSFLNQDKARIIKFTVYIKPRMNIHVAVKNLETLGLMSEEYKVQNPEANVFEINIPRLDYSYFSLKRLNDDYVKVVNRNTLRWRGNDYIKE